MSSPQFRTEPLSVLAWTESSGGRVETPDQAERVEERALHRVRREPRREERGTLMRRVQVELQDHVGDADTGRAEWTSLTLNASRSGLCVLMASRLRVGDLLKVKSRPSALCNQRPELLEVRWVRRLPVSAPEDGYLVGMRLGQA